jgi:hypothetical protein
MAFGDFHAQCSQAALPLCHLIGPESPISGGTGMQADCYARSVDIGNTLIFQGATGFLHILALIMTSIMIIHVRSKYTAVGRKEITSFFYIYMGLTTISLILDTGVIPSNNGAFPFFVAAQNGLASALCICLLINGFVGFQLYEDGTTLSVWLLRFFTTLMFIISGVVSLLTFKGWAGLGPANTVGMFVVLYIFNGIFIFVYLVMQVLLVVNTLQERWPLGDIIFGVFFFVIGQAILYVFGSDICDSASHYVDGLFFGTICNLLAVMMVYKVRSPSSDGSTNCSSTGTPSQRRTSSSASGSSRTTGRSRSYCPRRSGGRRSTRTPTRSTRTASTTCQCRRPTSGCPGRATTERPKYRFCICAALGDRIRFIHP